MENLLLSQLVDIQQLQQLLEAQYRLTGVLAAILDADENVLVAVGWQDICTRFHRKNPITADRCRHSDAHIKTRLDVCPEGYVDYRCRNGLRDVAVPILIHGRHLATFFTGQFFYDDDPPNIEFFKAQATRFGFDEAEYLAALKRVPVVSRDYIQNVMVYCRSLVQMMAETGLKNLRLAREGEERRKSEKEASFFRTLVENTQDCVYVLDPADGFRMFYVNPAACAHYGRDREAILKMRIPEWDPNFDMAKTEIIRQQMKQQKAVRFESQHRVASGELIPVEITASLLEYDGKELIAGYFVDITERKTMEGALRQSEHNLIEAQRIAQVGNWSWSPDGRLITASAECWRILAISPSQFPGIQDAWLDMISATDRGRVRRVYERLLKDLQPCSLEYRFLRSNGELVWIQEQRELVCNEMGRPGEVLATIQNISERLRLAQALRDKDLLLLQQSRMAVMGEMISYIAHQWRQPLHIVSMLVQSLTLEQNGRGIQREQVIEQVTDLLEHMSSTIDDFRDFFRTDRDMEPFDLKEATQKILNFITPDLKIHQITVHLETEQGLIVIGYANEFSHALLNIINNARDVLLERHIESPRIDLRLFRKGEKKIVTVRDNAGGISEETRQRLFDAYFTTKQSGTGIGLYISKIIIEKRLNGSLSAENVDNGLEMRIEL